MIDLRHEAAGDMMALTLNLIMDPDKVEFYGLDAARCVLKTLEEMQFSGQCDCFSTDGFLRGMPDCYLMGLALLNEDGIDAFKGNFPLVGRIHFLLFGQLIAADCGLGVDTSELVMLDSLMASHAHLGAAHFDKGKPVQLQNNASGDLSSFEQAVFENMNLTDK